MKDQELKQLAKALRRALKAKGHTVPHSVLLHGLAAISGETDWHVLTAHLKDAPPPPPDLPIPVLKLGEKPLSVAQLKALEASGRTRAIVEMDFNSLIDYDLEALLDELSERVTGSLAGLVDLSYRVVDTATHDANGLALAVYQNLSDWKPDQLKAYGLDALLESADSVLDLKDYHRTPGTIAVEVEGTIDWAGVGVDPEESAPVPMLESRTEGAFAIPALTYSDDQAVKASFDALPWFEQATDEAIVKLARCGFGDALSGSAEGTTPELVRTGFGGDYPADEVSIFMAGQNRAVERMHDYVSIMRNQHKDVGFECYVSRDEALKWIEENRGHLMAMIRADQ